MTTIDAPDLAKDALGEAAALVRSWRVGRRTCTLTAPQIRGGQVAFASIEWAPTRPRRLSSRELRQYRAGRDRAFADLCSELGIRGAIFEI